MLAPATTRDQHAHQLENSALHDLERKLRLIITARRTEGWTTTQTARLQRHVLAVAEFGLADAARFRQADEPRAERRVVVRWPR